MWCVEARASARLPRHAKNVLKLTCPFLPTSWVTRRGYSGGEEAVWGIGKRGNRNCVDRRISELEGRKIYLSSFEKPHNIKMSTHTDIPRVKLICPLELSSVNFTGMAIVAGFSLVLVDFGCGPNSTM